MSSYVVMSEMNGRVNRSRQTNRLPKGYLESVVALPKLDDEDAEEEREVHREFARQGLANIEAFDKLLTKGYVSTGRQYDDDWCERVEREDRYWDTLEARYGSTAAEEAEAEIAYQIASKRGLEAMGEVIEHFTAEVTAELFPAVTEGEHYGPFCRDFDEIRSEYWEFPWRLRGGREIGEQRALSLSEIVSNGRDELQQGWEEESYGGHGDY